MFVRIPSAGRHRRAWLRVGVPVARGRSRTVLAFGLTVAVAAAVLSIAGLGAAQDLPAGQRVGASPSVLPTGKTYTVTLLTGDVVTVHTRQSGCPVVIVRAAVPAGVQRRTCGPDGHVR